MKILYLCSQEPDYLGDGILYGLRKKYGPDLIDFPKKECMYIDQVNPDMYGYGFTLWGKLPDIKIDRSKVRSRVKKGYYDIIIFSDIFRLEEAYNHWNVYRLFEYAKENGSKIVFLDGQDDGHMSYPDAFNWGTYFKRDNPYNYEQIKIIGLSIPKEKVLVEKPVKTKMFTRYVQVDEAYRTDMVLEECNKERFETEEDYYKDLASSKYGISMKKSGWDVPRHMENAANWVVNCIYTPGWEWNEETFYQKPENTHPLGFKDMENCILWDNAEQLVEKINKVESGGLYDKIQKESRKWVDNKTCEKMAEYVIKNI